MLNQPNAVINDFIQALFSPFAKVLFRKNQQVLDDIAATMARL